MKITDRAQQLSVHCRMLRTEINHKEHADRIIHELEQSWTQICAALDLLGDASEAINFAAGKIENNTNFAETGEGYLLVYGLYQAFIIQRDSMLTLYKIFRVPNSKLEKKFKPISINRNQISGHPSSFKTRNCHSVKYFGISRGSITNPAAIIKYDWDDTWHQNGHPEQVSLPEQIDSHVGIMTAGITKLCERIRGRFQIAN